MSKNRVTYRKTSTFLLALLMMFLLQASAASILPPEKVIKNTATEMIAALKADKALLERDPDHVYKLVNRIMIPNFDLPLMAKRVLGKHWRRADVQQRKEFTAAFKQLLVRAYAKSLVNYSEREIHYLPVRKKKGAQSVAVRSEVARPGKEPLNVVYRLRLKETAKETTWKVFDVSIDGVSLVLNYRSTFSKEIKKGGLSSLIAKITKNRPDNER